MSYTWENGELITAEKLNQTGGSSKYDFERVQRLSSDCEGVEWIKVYGLPFGELMAKYDRGEVLNVRAITIEPASCKYKASLDLYRVGTSGYDETYSVGELIDDGGTSYGRGFFLGIGAGCRVTGSVIEIGDTIRTYTYDPQTREYVMGHEVESSPK